MPDTCTAARRGLCHIHRATHWPLADVAAVGGWKDIETLLKCYSQADRVTMLGVMSEPKKLRTADVGRRAGAADREALRRVAGNAAGR